MKKWIPLFILVLLIILFYIFDLQYYLSFAFFKNEHNHIQKIVKQNYYFSLIIFAVLYIILTAAALPFSAFLTIVGGYLFGPFVSLIVVDVCATIGTTLLFLTIKSIFRDLLKENTLSLVKKVEKGFGENASAYLLFLRLVPLFPFWVVTMASALLGMETRTFFFITLMGIIPGTFVYVWIGKSLGFLLEKGQAPDIYIIFSPQIFWPLFGLALLSLLPIFYKKKEKKRDGVNKD